MILTINHLDKLKLSSERQLSVLWKTTEVFLQSIYIFLFKLSDHLYPILPFFNIKPPIGK